MQTIKGTPIFHQAAPGRRSTPALYTPSPLFALPSSFSLLLLLASLLTLFFLSFLLLLHLFLGQPFLSQSFPISFYPSTFFPPSLHHLLSD